MGGPGPEFSCQGPIFLGADCKPGVPSRIWGGVGVRVGGVGEGGGVESVLELFICLTIPLSWRGWGRACLIFPHRDPGARVWALEPLSSGVSLP